MTKLWDFIKPRLAYVIVPVILVIIVIVLLWILGSKPDMTRAYNIER